jgi:cytochrome P450
MALVTELNLPEFDTAAGDLSGEVYHQRLAALSEHGWLARSPLATLVLDREAGEFFLRSRSTAFPGREIAQLFGITAGPLYEHIDANLLNMSGDDHRRLRRIIATRFSPPAADRWRPVMRAILEQLWTDLAHVDSAEVVSSLAKPYPALAIAAVLGAPPEDAPQLHEWSNWVQRQFDVRALSTELPRIERAVAESHAYVEALLAARREEPADDLLSTLLTAEDEGDRLSHSECVNLALNVLAGGVDTTQSQLGHALHLFASHPEQWALLGRWPELVPRAVQEVLRFEPITPFTARICTEDLEHRNVTFPAGTIVAICVERANREGDTGERFDITADREGRLLTFGAGPHFCLGANLARAELEEALSFLLGRMPGMSLDGSPTFAGIEGIYGVETLALRWQRAASATI